MTKPPYKPAAPFIPRWMDETKLSRLAFRVLSHLWRRAKLASGPPFTCTPSVTTIAKVCGISKRDTVHAALNELCDLGLLERKRRKGTSNLFFLVVPTNETSWEKGYPEERDNGCPDDRGNGCPDERDTKVLLIRSPNKVPQDIAESIYALYPRKIARTDAIKAIIKALKTTPADKLIAAVKAYADAVSRWPAEEHTYIPYPATWFNRGHYDDDPATWKRPGSTSIAPKPLLGDNLL